MATLAEHLRFGDLQASQKTLELGNLGVYPGAAMCASKMVGEKISHHPGFLGKFFFFA